MRLGELPLNLMAVLVALLLACQVLSMATHPDATHVANDVCLTDTLGNFCNNALLDPNQVEIR